ncbi:MAG: L-serine ammonia-lyase, iron-sulfur-dependent, subunit alpha, partial [Peptostreptococcales bacterium]
EPIAIAYASALLKKHLGEMPLKYDVEVSGNIIKNVKGVIVPNTNGLRGIEVAVIAGSLSSEPESKLEVLNYISREDMERIPELLKNTPIKIEQRKDKDNLYISVEGAYEQKRVKVTLEHKHTNITLIEKNGEIVFSSEEAYEELNNADYEKMSFNGLYDYADQGHIDSVKKHIKMQVNYNYEIACIGLENNYGMNIGKTLMNRATTIYEKACAYAAAGSDARMSGSTSPVVINSGSGNQGMTVAVPVYIYAKEMKCNKETMYRALILSNLVAIYIKSKIGTLSAFCGAVSAATGAGAAITYILTRDKKMVENTIKNALSNLTGVICDGAKPSCAYKVESSLHSAFLASELAIAGNVAEAGIIFDDIEKTIDAVGKLGKEGMKCTDEVILNIMVD